MTKIISYIHLLACIGWSIFLFYILITVHPKDTGAILALSPLFAVTASGIYLFVVRRNKLLESIKNPNAILWTGVVIVTLMCLFPPWITFEDYQGRRLLRNGEVEPYKRIPAGFSFIYDPPNERAEIDYGRLIIELVPVGLVVATVMFTIRNKKKE